MNVIHKVTLSTLKKNKRRTVVTILGTAVAVAMVTALAVLFASVMDMMRMNAIESVGNWHISYDSVDKTAIPLMQENANIDYIDMSFSEGFAAIPGREENTRRELAITGFNIESLARLPITLVEGRLPQQPGEILLSDTFLRTTDMGWAVNSSVELDFGFYEGRFTDEDGLTNYLENRNPNQQIKGLPWKSEGLRSFTVVGYADIGRLEQSWQDSFTAVTIFSPEDTVAGKDYFQANLGMKKVGAGTFSEGRALAAQLATHYNFSSTNDVPMSFNSHLLGFSGVIANGETFTALLIFFSVLLLIIVAGAVSLIGNAFSISLSERVRSLGMLAGVGATKRQKRSSVMFEAGIIGIFAIPAGIIGGIAGIYITLSILGSALGNLLSSDTGMRLVVPIWAVMFTVLFSAGILFLSAFMPALRASRIAPVEAMRNAGNAEKVHKARKSPVTRKLMGFEAELGIKNSKRSRRRYYSILSSLIISVVLFLTVSAAMHYVKTSFGLAYSSRDDLESSYNVTATIHATSHEVDYRATDVVKQIRAIPSAGAVDIYTTFTPNAYLPPSALTAAGLKEILPESSGEHQFTLQIYALDEETFQRYCEKAGLSPSILLAEGTPFILLAPIQARFQSGVFGEITSTKLQKGDAITANLSHGYEAGVAFDINIAAVSHISPDVVTNRFPGPGIIPLVTSMDVLQQIPEMTQDSYGFSGMFVNAAMKSLDSNETYDQLEELQIADKYSMYAYNSEANVQMIRMGILVLEVFTYGFIILITLVCAANIFNTVSTGIALRSREFAMLRSAGLTPKGFNRMLNSETLFYGLKALLWGMPLSALLSFGLYRALNEGFGFPFSLPWGAYIITAIGVFVLVGFSALYARSKLKSLNIAETLKKENW